MATDRETARSRDEARVRSLTRGARADQAAMGTAAYAALLQRRRAARSAEVRARTAAALAAKRALPAEQLGLPLGGESS